MDKYQILYNYFNYTCFRSGQEEIIDSIISKKNTLAILATGGGKSICFQVPALYFDGITLVISPLISLMEDQVRNLLKNNISAAYINSSLDKYKQQEILNDLKNYKIKILYIAPEKLKNEAFLSLLLTLNISQIVLDEAHSLSLYGHDFRPDYKDVSLLFNKLESHPVISLFSATASFSVVEDIKKILKIDLNIFKFGFDRKNLFYSKIETNDKLKELIKLLKEHEGKSVIIYALTRKVCESVFKSLKELGFKVALYHALLSDEDKKKYNEMFLTDELNIMVATNAYGMGIDKPDIRLVINLGFPMSLEDLSQQQGRCSRDNEKGECVLIYNMKDVWANRFFINKVDENINISKEEKKIVKKTKEEKLNEVLGYARTKRCLHEYIVSHFGELFKSNCNNCINCISKKKTKDYIYESKLIIDTIKETKEIYGTNMIAKILTGSKDAKIKEKKFYKLRTYNKLTLNVNEVKDIIINLVDDGYIDKTYDEYPILKLNENSETIYSKENYFLKV